MRLTWVLASLLLAHWANWVSKSGLRQKLKNTSLCGCQKEKHLIWLPLQQLSAKKVALLVFLLSMGHFEPMCSTVTSQWGQEAAAMLGELGIGAVKVQPTQYPRVHGSVSRVYVAGCQNVGSQFCSVNRHSMGPYHSGHMNT